MLSQTLLLLPISLLLTPTAALPQHNIPHTSGAQFLSDLAALTHRRALSPSPSGTYAPAILPCPANPPTIRSATTLSPAETAWLSVRRPQTVDPMIAFLDRLNLSDFDAASYIRTAAQKNTSALPTVALAVSGGGYRALMNGAGFLKAADARVPGTTDAGGLGGLLQASTYLAGLSGGGWLVGSLYANDNFSTVQDLQYGGTVWKFDRSIFVGPEASGGIGIVNTAEYWVDVAEQVAAKARAGFDTTITDYWGRALSYQLVGAPDGGPALTFSSIAEDDGFGNGEVPLPILVADGRAPDQKIVSLNATVFEFTPFEMGSYDPTVYGFAPLEWLASNFSGGRVPQGGHCVRGFDQVGFVMGTSSSLFNQFLLSNLTTINVPSVVVSAVEAVLRVLGDRNDDIAKYVPNPFLGWSPETNPSVNSLELSLVDGGEDLQNIPLTPLINPRRGVDVVFAVDSSADTPQNWPNATALRATYDRSRLSSIANGTAFPAVPDANTFINKGLNARPVFFGCDAGNFTGAKAVPPLVVYIPNAPYTAFSNVSTFTPSYTLEERDAIIQNGLNSATQLNGTLDGKWPACVGCAILSRSLWRTGTEVPQVCKDCFHRYCWDGTLDTSEPPPYMPGLRINATASGATSGSNKGAGAVVLDRWRVAWTAVAAVGLGAWMVMV